METLILMEEFISIMQDFGFEYTISDRDTLTKYFYNNRKFKIIGIEIEDVCIVNELVTIKLQEDYEDITIEIISDKYTGSFIMNKECTIHYKVDKRGIVTIQIFETYEKGCESDIDIIFKILD